MRARLLTVTTAALVLTWQAAAAPSASKADQSFAVMAAQAGQAQLQAGQLAQQSASMPRLRKYGQSLATSYAQFNDQLQQIAQGKNLELPSQPTVYQHAQGQQLLGAGRENFDRAFLTQQVRAQGGYLVRFQQEAKSGHDPDLRKLAHDSLPMLRQQLMTAQSLLNQLPAAENTWHGQD